MTRTSARPRAPARGLAAFSGRLAESDGAPVISPENLGAASQSARRRGCVASYARPVESGTRAIGELAWARVLGLADDALAPGSYAADPVRGRVTRVDDALASFVTLWDHR